MSKYTRNDTEVIFLEKSDRVEFEFDMLNHDVDKNVELTYGVSAIRKSRSIQDTFDTIKDTFTDAFKDPMKNPQKVQLAITTSLTIILTGVAIVALVVFIYCYVRDKPEKTEALTHMAKSCVLLFAMLLVFYAIYNYMAAEIQILLMMVREKPKDETV